jgi:large subunit ribosomal protein L23
MHPYEVLKRPLITEKTQWAVGHGLPQYAFEVDSRATKAQIKEAVEVAFDVTVTRVNVAIMPAKLKLNPRTRQPSTRRSQWKKAIVQVKSGDRIALFEGVA